MLKHYGRDMKTEEYCECQLLLTLSYLSLTLIIKLLFQLLKDIIIEFEILFKDLFKMCQMFRLLINQINESLDQNQSQKNFSIN